MKTKKRPNKDDYYLGIAKAVSERGTCLRRQFGAVIVNKDEVVSTGYVGAPRGTPNCTDLKKCFRQEKGIPSGSKYELCRSVHAEQNAIIHASRGRMNGGTIYVYGLDKESNNETIEAKPCKLCRRMIINAGLEKVIISTPTREPKEIKVETWIEEANKHPFKELNVVGY